MHAPLFFRLRNHCGLPCTAMAGLILVLPLLLAPTSAKADDSDMIEAPLMADVEVSLAATLRTSIEAGEITLADIKRSGLSYNFRVHHVAGKDPSGYCNTDGNGNVDDVNAVHQDQF